MMSPQQRKARSELILKREGIPILPSLPCIESEVEVSCRTSKEVGIRIACLVCVAGSAFEPSDSVFFDYIRRFQLCDHLTPLEMVFLTTPSPEERTRIQFTWRSEAVFLLMWAARLFDELPLPRHETSTTAIVSRFPEVDESPWPFINDLQLREVPELLDASDLIYRLHWATRQSQLHSTDAVANIVPGAVQEWHHAINWITRYGDEEWDTVATDT